MKTLVEKLEWYVPAARLFGKFREDCPAVFLDSSLTGENGRYAVIGRNPYLTLEEREGICFANDSSGCRELTCSFENALAAWLNGHPEEKREEISAGLPLISGALGYFSYDFGRKYEGIRSRHPVAVAMPDARMTFFDNLIIEDCVEQKLYLTASGFLSEPKVSMGKLKQEVRAAVEETVREESLQKEKPVQQTRQAAYQANFKKEDYRKAICDMISYIYEGEIYVANMTQQLTVKSAKDPFEVFRYLRIHNPSPFGAYLDYGDVQIICASPERFLRVQNGQVETRPIKGTRPRGNTPEEDARLREELVRSEKDRSELLMIVDLERNDLNHVCVPGSVKVTEHFAVEEYATVFHLVTTVVGELREECGVPDLLRAAFPGGSITGAPKIRAMEIIDELEHSRRGLYTGSIGYLSFEGACDLNIVIRTAIHQNGVYHIGAGGGITCESETEFEYEETLQKAKAVLEAIYDGESG